MSSEHHPRFDHIINKLTQFDITIIFRIYIDQHLHYLWVKNKIGDLFLIKLPECYQYKNINKSIAHNQIELKTITESMIPGDIKKNILSNITNDIAGAVFICDGIFSILFLSNCNTSNELFFTESTYEINESIFKSESSLYPYPIINLDQVLTDEYATEEIISKNTRQFYKNVSCLCINHHKKLILEAEKLLSQLNKMDQMYNQLDTKYSIDRYDNLYMNIQKKKICDLPDELQNYYMEIITQINEIKKYRRLTLQTFHSIYSQTLLINDLNNEIDDKLSQL